MHDAILAREIMDPLRTVPEDMPIRELARTLVAGHHDGVCVTDAGGQLVGVVTAMDLLFQEKPVKGPTIFWLIDSPIILGQSRFEHETQKQIGATVKDVMTREPTTVTEDTRMGEIATLMVENGYTILPVMRDGVAVGVISKWAVLRSVLGS